MNYLKENYRELSGNQNLLNPSRFVYENAPQAEPEQPTQTPGAEQVNLSPEDRQRLDSIKEKLIAEKKVIDINIETEEFRKKFVGSPEKWKEVEPTIRKELKDTLRELLRGPIDEAKKKAVEAAMKQAEEDPGFFGKIKKTIQDFFKKFGIDKDKNGWFTTLLGLIGVDTKSEKFKGVAEFLGLETPKSKFAATMEKIKVPAGYKKIGSYAETKDIKVVINNPESAEIATITYNTETGLITLVSNEGTFSSNDPEDINKHLVASKLQQTAPAPEAAQAAAPAPAAPEQKETPEARYTRLFEAKGWKLDFRPQDLAALGIPEDKIEEAINAAATEGSNFDKLYKAIKAALEQNKVFKLRLTDLLNASKLKPENITQLVGVISGKTNRSPEKIRKFLDDVQAAQGGKLKLAAAQTEYQKA